MTDIVKQDIIGKKIFLIRGMNVMLDKDLAGLYGVTTGNLNKAVNRNIDRFPGDFMFRLTKEEFNNLRFHFGISNLRSQFGTSSWGGRRYLPYAFTEQGVAMLSSVLNSERAIQVNIGIMQVFVNIRRLVSTNKGILGKLNQLEGKVMPSTDTVARGQYSEVKRTVNVPPFDEWWDKSEDILEVG